MLLGSLDAMNGDTRIMQVFSREMCPELGLSLNGSIPLAHYSVQDETLFDCLLRVDHELCL